MDAHRSGLHHPSDGPALRTVAGVSGVPPRGSRSFHEVFTHKNTHDAGVPGSASDAASLLFQEWILCVCVCV